MNICQSYHISCPYALSGSWDGLPCIGSQKQCDDWRRKYQDMISKAPQEEENEKKDLTEKVNYPLS
jgi:hypothetical protein